jgi:uncharacterized HhH-GPD family protein
VAISLPIEDAANELLNRDPLALLLAMMLDQQVTFEKAFGSPHELARRLGHEPTASELADFDPDALAEIFSARPALHRFPKAMAARAQELAAIVCDRYGGDAGALWATAATGEELRRRVAGLPGFGALKAQIMVALLGKRIGITPPGWREAAGQFGAEGSHISIADIADAESLAAVRAYKKAAKAAAKRSLPPVR